MRPLKNVQTKDYIADAVRREIMSGNIEPGEELAQEAFHHTAVYDTAIAEYLAGQVAKGAAK